MMEKKQKSETVQKLEKKVEKLQDQLSEAKCSNQTLKNKLAETKNLQVRVGLMRESVHFGWETPHSIITWTGS